MTQLIELTKDEIISKIKTEINDCLTVYVSDDEKNKKRIIQCVVPNHNDKLVNFMKSQGYDLGGFDDFENDVIMIFYHL